jgi:DNA-binding transcriptional MocR family regulator
MPVFIGIRVAEIPDLQADLALYREAWRDAGHPGDPSVYLRVPVYVTTTEEGAVEEPRESLTYFFGRQTELARSAVGRAGTPEARKAQAERMAKLTYEDILAKKVVSGTAPRVIDRLTELREALALHAGHGVEGTWAANGSNECLQQLLLAFAGPGRSALVVEPTYAMHSLLARATGTRVVTRVQAREELLDPDAAADLVAEAAADLTFWCSPNNPTGEATGPDVLAAVCAAAPGLVVVDEAYGEFGTSHAAALLTRFPNLVVTRTFSKAFRMAGVRLGYLLADPAVVDGVRLVRLPYHLSALTQAVGLRALRHKGALMDHIAVTERERERGAGRLGGHRPMIWPYRRS